jgi:uncharacterized lipoprotein NlpE involved in copper resistance
MKNIKSLLAIFTIVALMLCVSSCNSHSSEEETAAMREASLTTTTETTLPETTTAATTAPVTTTTAATTKPFEFKLTGTESDVISLNLNDLYEFSSLI